jgi:hypothetical protein
MLVIFTRLSPGKNRQARLEFTSIQLTESQEKIKKLVAYSDTTGAEQGCLLRGDT